MPSCSPTSGPHRSRRSYGGRPSTTSGRRVPSSSEPSPRSCRPSGPALRRCSPTSGRAASSGSRRSSPDSPRTTGVSQLQPRLPSGPGAAARPLVRALRQVLLHRPRPRSVHGRTDLAAVFDGAEPLDNPDNEERFRTLLALGPEAKPFECVGDIDECRAAALLAAQRRDRIGHALLPALRDEVAARHPRAPRAPTPTPAALLAPAWATTAFPIAMRQPISWSALADAAVGVWGLGVEGQASVRRLAAMGVTPVLVDDTPSAADHDGHPRPRDRRRRPRRAGAL